MLKRKRKRNPENKKTLRHLAEFLADAIENHNTLSYLYAEKIRDQLKKEDPLFCEECQNFIILDRIQDHDPQLCFENTDIDDYDMSHKALEEAAEDLAEDLGIKDYVKVFTYSIQYDNYQNSRSSNKPSQDLSGINLSKMDLSRINLANANASRANLSRANLSNADLYWADLSGANLSGATLSGADLSGADLYWADLSGANLSGATLSGADLSWADLSGANFTGANLSDANLSGANLSRANLSNDNLSGADLSGANLYKANFTNVKITHYTCFKHAINMDEAINLVINNPGKISKTNKISLKCAASGKNFTYAKKESNKKNSKKKRKLTD